TLPIQNLHQAAADTLHHLSQVIIKLLQDITHYSRSPTVTATSRTSPPRTMVNVTSWPTLSSLSASSNSSITCTASPSSATRMSPCSRSLCSAGLFASIDPSIRPISCCICSLSAGASRTGCAPMPRYPRRTLPCDSNDSTTLRMVAVGTVRLLLLRDNPDVFRPRTNPPASTSGPPEKPGYITTSV